MGVIVGGNLLLFCNYLLRTDNQIDIKHHDHSKALLLVHLYLFLVLVFLPQSGVVRRDYDFSDRFIEAIFRIIEKEISRLNKTPPNRYCGVWGH